MNTPTYISNYKAVMDLYGHWPSFHDANVIAYDNSNDVITLTLHTWNMTKEVDEKGYYILKDHSLVSFRFKDIYDVNMNSFAPGNILFGLEFISNNDTSFKVELDSVMDMSGSFFARSGEVISIVPCASDGNKL